MYMPERVEEVRLRTDRKLLVDMFLSRFKPASLRKKSLACREESREGVVGELKAELVDVRVKS